jgi:ABC-type bacteriocin/lantibiotic exporter with double-glycine peptidase domain
MKVKLIRNPENEREHDVYTKSGFLSKIMFNWINDLVTLGNKKRLNLEDMKGLPPVYESEFNKTNLETVWNVEKLKGGRALFRSLAITYKSEFFLSMSLNLVLVLFEASGPFIIKSFIEFVNDTSISMWNGVYLGVAFVLITLMENLISEQAVFYMIRMGIRSQKATVSLIYEKSLRLSNATNK